MRSKAIPPDAEVIRTFDELRDFRDSFFSSEFYFLLLVGRQGLSKSCEFEERCRPRRDRDGNEFSIAHYIKGNVTPVEAYRLAYEHQNKLLVFDDAERLWSDMTGRFLIRDLTENKPSKEVSWRVANKHLEREGVPKSFTTTSRVCLIMNRPAFGDISEYDAIVDRSQFVYFNPTPLEIHKNAVVWFWDQEVHDYVGEHLNLVDKDKLSSRTYVKACERKAKGDWREFIARRYFTQSGEQWVQALECDPRYPCVEDRVAEFTKQTGLKRSTYFSLKKTLRGNGQLFPFDVPKFTLTARPPEMRDLEAEAMAAAEEDRRHAERERLEEQEEQDYRNLEDEYFGDQEGDEDG